MSDRSNGWEAVAHRFMAARSQVVGVSAVRTWAQSLPNGSSILDVGCGSGVPVSQALMDEGCVVSGVDASPTLVAAFRARFPNAAVACEPAEESSLFNATFDGVVSIGLVFLLSTTTQRKLLRRLSRVVKPGGRLLFTAPRDACSWTDILTGRVLMSLGSEEYEAILCREGMSLAEGFRDEGGNYYHDVVRRRSDSGSPASS